MNLDWFNSEFIHTCIDEHIEPTMTGDKLMLICPKLPPKETQDKIKSLIPDGQAYTFSEDLRRYTVAVITKMLGMAQVKGTLLYEQGHRVKVQIQADPINSNMAMDSGFWPLLAGVLRKDPYVAGYVFELNGKEIWNSDTEDPDSVPNTPGLEEGLKFADKLAQAVQTALEETRNEPPQNKKSSAKLPNLDDGRFEYEKDFLPADAATDVRILLESTGSVDEFLKQI